MVDAQAAIAFLEELAGFSGAGAGELPSISKISNPSDQAGASARGRGWQPDLRYRSLIEKLPAVTFMAALDERTQELYISPQIEAMLGFTQEEWLENPILWYDQLHPDDRELWVAEFARTCTTGFRFSSEYRLIARDGRVVWVQGECQIIRDDTGRPMFLQGIAFDITARKRAAAADEERRAAEAASLAKSEFLAHMSHEIRTPLNGVLGMIDLVLPTELNDKQRKFLELAKMSGESLAALVNDILDFSKIEAGKLDIESITFDLRKVLEQVKDIQSLKANAKGLQVLCEVPAEVPALVQGDPSRVRQILINLINNAIKFTERGSVTVRAGVEEVGNEHLVVRFGVTDTGIGIPPDRMNRLFKSFSQVDGSTTRKYGGTGLGLAISKQLTELMGGQIGVESEAGKGTTFWFTVKFGHAAEQALTETPTPETPDRLEASPPAACRLAARILIAEDNEVNQIVLSELLADEGYRYEIVNDGKQAVEAVLRNHFDMVLMDCQMPVMDGFEASRAIRQNEGTGRRIPIVALTANATKADRDRCLENGMDAHCTKPIEIDDLLKVIASLLSRSQPAQPAQAAA